MPQQNIPEVPVGLDQALYNHLQGMRNAILALQPSVVPPGPVTNFTVTPGPGSNFIQFTRSNGDSYALYVNTVSSLNGAVRYDLGKANSFTHNIGAANELRYYFVVTILKQQSSTPAGPIAGTTLSLASPITLPAPAAPSATPTTDASGNVIPGVPTPNQYQVDL